MACGHASCRSCVLRLLATRNRRCAVCKTRLTATAQEVREWPKIFQLQAIADTLASSLSARNRDQEARARVASTKSEPHRNTVEKQRLSQEELDDALDKTYFARGDLHGERTADEGGTLDNDLDALFAATTTQSVRKDPDASASAVETQLQLESTGRSGDARRESGADSIQKQLQNLAL